MAAHFGDLVSDGSEYPHTSVCCFKRFYMYEQNGVYDVNII